MGMFVAAVAFLTLETIADLLQPAFMAYIVDVGVVEKDIGQILKYGAIMLGIATVGAVGAVSRNILASKTSQLVGMELRGGLYRKVQSLSLENIDRLKPAAIITRITNDVTQIVNFVQGIMRIIIKTPIICAGAVALIILQTPRLFPVMAAIIAISALLITANMKLAYPRYGKLQSRLDKLNNVSREFLSSIRVVKAFNAEETECEKFHDAASQLAEAGVDAARVLAVFGPLINLVVNFGIVLLLWLSRAQNAGDIGRLMASVNYMTQVLFSLGVVSIILNNAVRATASASRIQEVFDEFPTQVTRSAAATADIDGAVEFENVSFTYAGAARPALGKLSFTVKKGETVGIIGSTGSGKSTLASLLPRFYDATGGRVLVGGVDVREIDTEVLRRHIAVVPQKALLFSGSIEQNLRFGKPDASEDEILSASKVACADDFISAFRDGYDTELAQGGVNLSGGQKQRLCIARALIARPKILILDDCTSALDANTESKVLSALRSDTKGVTVLLISQRISTVMRCNRVLCMEDGNIQGYGTHSELMANCEHYRAIYESQIGSDADA